jgi:hypothetical protein
MHRRALVLLILIEEKTLSNPTDAQSQVIAEAMAAFQFNNRRYTTDFYLVLVTLELSNTVATAQYHSSETVVSKCVAVMTHARRASDRMEDTQYRQEALSFQNIGQEPLGGDFEGSLGESHPLSRHILNH